MVRRKEASSNNNDNNNNSNINYNNDIKQICLEWLSCNSFCNFSKGLRPSALSLRFHGKKTHRPTAGQLENQTFFWSIDSEYMIGPV